MTLVPWKANGSRSRYSLPTSMQALERAGAGHGQVVALVGEAGVGKSRLVYECLHSHHSKGWRILESAPDVTQAEVHYCQALADALGMRPLVAHCHRSLGMPYASTGQQE